MVAVKGFRQARHLYRPGRVLLPFSSVASSTTPQWGHTGPSGQRNCSKWTRAAVLSVKILSVRSKVMAKNPSFWPRNRLLTQVRQVHKFAVAKLKTDQLP